MLGVLIANKIDLSDRQVITNETGEELAQRLGLSFFPCSAVSNSFFNLL